MTISILNYFFSFAATVFFIFLLKPLAKHFDLVDIPGGRKQHQGEIPLIGGVAMFLGFVIALLSLNISLLQFHPFLIAAILLVLIGVLDDLHELTMLPRFIGQIVAAMVVVCWGHHILENLGNFLFTGDFYLYYAAIPFTILIIVAVINAVNMTDGADGLAGMLALVEFSMLAILVRLDSQIMNFKVIMIIIFSLLAFMLFNFPFSLRKKTKIFMGDAGSMFLGLGLAWFLIDLSQGMHPVAKPVTMLWIMLVPFFDILRVIIYRVIKKESPFKADQNHLHHILAALGFSNLKVVGIMSGLALCFGLIGVIGDVYAISEPLMFFAFLFLFVIYYRTIDKITKFKLKLNQCSLEAE